MQKLLEVIIGLDPLSPAEPSLLSHVCESVLFTCTLPCVCFFLLITQEFFVGLCMVILAKMIKPLNFFTLPDKTFFIKQDQSSSRRSAEHTFIDFITTQGIAQDQHVCMLFSFHVSPFVIC